MSEEGAVSVQVDSDAAGAWDKDTLSWWRGTQGDEYMRRNEPPDWYVMSRRATLRTLLDGFQPPRALLEVGCGPGANLEALRPLYPSAELHAAEPNASARRIASARVPTAIVRDAAATHLPYQDETFDLVLTCGVLIHVNPENGELARALSEIIRVTKAGGLILTAEYFAPRVEALAYRGSQAGVLWRADFGEGFLNVSGQLAPPVNLQVLQTGFLWRMNTAFDDLTYWLIRRMDPAASWL